MMVNHVHVVMNYRHCPGDISLASAVVIIIQLSALCASPAARSERFVEHSPLRRRGAVRMCSSTRQRHRALADRPHRVNMVLTMPTALIASAAGRNCVRRLPPRPPSAKSADDRASLPDDGQRGIAKMTVGVLSSTPGQYPGRWRPHRRSAHSHTARSPAPGTAE